MKLNADRFEHHVLSELREIHAPGFPHFYPIRTAGSLVSYDYAVYANYWKMSIEGRELDSHVMRSLLPAQRRALLPNKYHSVFLSVHWPQHLSSARGGDGIYETWKELGFRGCFRYHLPAADTARLAALEKTLSGPGPAQGLALCLAPVLGNARDAEIAVAGGTVLQHTHFQSPARLVNAESYSYVSADRPGRVHPSGDAPNKALGRELVPAQFFRSLLDLREGAVVEPFVAHVARLWDAFVNLDYGDADALELGADRKSARELLGEAARLPVDPLRVLPDAMVELALLSSGSDAPRLEDLATVIFAIHRLAREKLGATWIVFYN